MDEKELFKRVKELPIQESLFNCVVNFDSKQQFLYIVSTAERAALLEKKLKKLEERVNRYEEALKFYANGDNWTELTYKGDLVAFVLNNGDSGEIARQALEDTVYKTVTVGNLKIKNVPHFLYPSGIGPDGEKEYMPSSVLYKLSHLIRYMANKEIFEMNYDDISLGELK